MQQTLRVGVDPVVNSVERHKEPCPLERKQENVVPLAVPRLDVRARKPEKVQARKMAPHRGPVQRRLALLCHRVHTRPARDQAVHNVQMPVVRSPVQPRRRLLVVCVDLFHT